MLRKIQAHVITVSFFLNEPLLFPDNLVAAADGNAVFKLNCVIATSPGSI